MQQLYGIQVHVAWVASEYGVKRKSLISFLFGVSRLFFF